MFSRRLILSKVAKKRKADASIKPVGKRANAAGRKKIVAAPKAAAAAPKAATIVALETVVASAPKARAMPKSSATTMAAAAASKVAAVGQNGALGMAKVVPLKVKSGVKRPSDLELSLAKTVKESKKFSLASSSIPASTQRADIPSSPTPGSDDDDRVELILMMGVVHHPLLHLHRVTHLCLSPPELPRSDLDVVISSVVVILGSELQTIPEMTELESTRLEVEHEMTGLDAPHGASGCSGKPLK
jgi:hypothetical protein